MRRLSAALLALLAPAGCAESAFPDSASHAGEARALFDLADKREVAQWDVDPSALGDVPCVDQQIAELSLMDTPAAGLISPIAREGSVFEDAIDATAGGLSATDGYVYARFGTSGLEKVSLDDELAFESRDWDIAFRRYVIRLNSGVSGPSSVSAARTPANTTFAAVTSVAPDLTFRVEQYYTPSCVFVADESGIGSPATALSSFWAYHSCLSMTGNVFVLKLASGRHVKLQILAYYSPENQALCDRSGATDLPSGAGNIRMRWAFLD